MGYVVIILALALTAILVYIGIQKYNEVHEELEVQREQIAQQEELLEEKQKTLENQEELFHQERDIFNLEKKVFLRSKAARFELDEKSEKEIAIELYTHFVQMEAEFARYQRSLDSINQKLVGVKDYSEQMDSLTAAVCDQFTLYKDNLVSTNEQYIQMLQSLQRDVNRIMDTLMSEMEDMINESATKTFVSLNKDVHVLLENIAYDISSQVVTQMPKAIQKEEVQVALEQVINVSVKNRLEEILHTLRNHKEEMVESVVEEFKPLNTNEEKETMENLFSESTVEEMASEEVEKNSNAEDYVLEMLPENKES
ncbi:MAG: hypothetical protein Q4C49_07135 [Bacillota bacterium]|nr:hypothetical protein [Bacillota bacterium]